MNIDEIPAAVIESFTKYKGSDWVGMTFGLASAYFVAKEKRVGFILAAICGGGWLAFGVLTGSIASVISNIFLIFVNLHGWLRWKNKDIGE